MMRKFSAPTFVLLFLSKLCFYTSAQDSSITTFNALQKIRAIGKEPSSEDIKTIIEFSTNESRVVTEHLLPGPALTVADYVASKVSTLRGNPSLEASVLQTFLKDEVTEKQFAVLLKVFQWEEMSDLKSARLQANASRFGSDFEVILLIELGRNPAKIGDQFDLLIDSAIHSDEVETIVAGCRAIINKKNRALVWNSRLIQLLEEPLEGRLAIAPDFQVPYDFRSTVLHALRVNGYPSSDFVEFMSSWKTTRGSELHFQKLATRYAVLGEDTDIREVIDGLFIQEWRVPAATALSDDVLLPEDCKQEILKAVLLEEDVAASMLTGLFVEQFTTDGLSTQEIEKLESRMSPSFRRQYKKRLSNVQGHTLNTPNQASETMSDPGKPDE